MEAGAPTHCPACGAAVRAGARFCAACGTRIQAASCVSCKAALPIGARFCDECGTAASAERPAPSRGREPVAWWEERKLATVLFGDMSGFTSISSRLEPDEVRELVNECFQPLSREVEAHGGTVVKYIGDALMAAFGVPVAGEDDAVRAVRAALAMRERLGELAPRIEARFGAPIAMRIGINTGRVMVGTVGTAERGYDVMGAPVNLASRIEGVAARGDVLVGEATYRLLGDLFEVAPLGSMKLKGLDELQRVYRVVGLRPEVRKGASARQPLVRERELDILLRAADGVAQSRRLRVVKLVGDPGSGMGRLLSELEGALARRAAPFAIWTQTATTAGSGAPLGVLARLVREQHGVTADDHPAEARERVIAAVMAGADARPDDARDTAQALADLAGLGGEASGVLAAAGRPDHERVLRALAAWIRQAAAEQPLCLVLGEMQWADDASLDHVERLLERLAELPVFLILTARPDLEKRRPGWAEEGPSSERLTLGPLPPLRMAALIDELVGDVRDFPASVRERLVARSEGSPGMARELVRLLLDRGAIQDEEGGARRWTAGSPEELVLPDTVLGILQARLDRLAPDDKGWLKRAASVGAVFWAGAVLAAELGDDGEELASSLTSLQAAGITRVRLPALVSGEQEFGFRSEALREVAYESVPRTQREKWHARIAEWMERRGQLWPGGHAEIAWHFEAGGQPERARPHLVAAGRHALSLCTDRQAVELLERALARWTGAEQAAERALVRRELALALRRLGRFDDALKAEVAAETDLTLAGTPPTDVRFAWIALERARIAKDAGRVSDALGELERGLERIKGQAPTVLSMELHAERAFLRASANNGGGAKEDCCAGLLIAEQIEDHGVAWQLAAATLHDTLGAQHLYAGEAADAEVCYRRALDLRERASDRRGKLLAHINLGAIAHARADYAAAGEHFAQALADASSLGWQRYAAIAQSNLGQAMLAAGRGSAAVRELETARALAVEVGASDVIVDCSCALAQARLAAGDAQAALAEAVRAIGEAQGSGHAQLEAAAHEAAMDCLLAGAQAAEGTARAATLRHLEAAIALHQAAGRPGAAAEIAALRARAEERVNPPNERAAKRKAGAKPAKRKAGAKRDAKPAAKRAAKPAAKRDGKSAAKRGTGTAAKGAKPTAPTARRAKPRPGPTRSR